MIKNKGKNNKIIFSKGINLEIKIYGNDNSITVLGYGANKKILPPPEVFFPFLSKHHISIKIRGNNNSVYINTFKLYKNLKIDIGGLAEVENTHVTIGEKMECSELTIYAYQNNSKIQIGDNCLISAGVKIRSGELPHKIFNNETNENIDNSDGIYIGNHVWIGENVYIMKRAKISDNSIIGSASVVTKKFDESNVVIAGNPAKICKRNVNWQAD